jgi:hypothetical protein
MILLIERARIAFAQDIHIQTLVMSQAAYVALAPPLPHTLPPNAHATTMQCDGLNVIRVDNFFSTDECKALLASLSPSLPLVDPRASSRRQRLQTDIVEQPLIDCIWSRLTAARSLSPDTEQLLGSLTIDDDGDGLDGQWSAAHLRPRLLFAGYGPTDFYGQHFDLRVTEDGRALIDMGAEKDNMARKSASLVSHVTAVVYLNENGRDFVGGCTNILKPPPDPPHIIESIALTTGSALLFLQEQVYHEGGAVQSGNKFILRADVLYRRVNADGSAEKS